MPDLPSCGTFVFSSTPLPTRSEPEDAQAVVEGPRPGSPFVLLPVDLPSPTTGSAAWVDGFTHLSDAVAAHRGSPLVAAGDFIAVHEHAPMRRLLEGTGLVTWRRPRSMDGHRPSPHSGGTRLCSAWTTCSSAQTSGRRACAPSDRGPGAPCTPRGARHGGRADTLSPARPGFCVRWPA